MIKKFLISLLILSLSSCGFRLVYKNDDLFSSYSKELASIRIKKNLGELSYNIRNNLYDELNPDNITSEPLYFLSISILETSSPTFITTTGASGRNRISLMVSYKLENIENAEKISEGNFSVNENYNVNQNRYATFATEKYTKNNLGKIVSQNLRNALINDMIEIRKKCEKNINDIDFKCPLKILEK